MKDGILFSGEGKQGDLRVPQHVVQQGNSIKNQEMKIVYQGLDDVSSVGHPNVRAGQIRQFEREEAPRSVKDERTSQRGVLEVL